MKIMKEVGEWVIRAVSTKKHLIVRLFTAAMAASMSAVPVAVANPTATGWIYAPGTGTGAQNSTFWLHSDNASANFQINGTGTSTGPRGVLHVSNQTTEYNGTISAFRNSAPSSQGGGNGTVIFWGNTTLNGNIGTGNFGAGSANRTNSVTIKSGNTLTMSDGTSNITSFYTNVNGTLSTGRNNVINTNASIKNGGVLNIGSGTTFNGAIYGYQTPSYENGDTLDSGNGTVNIAGNFTSGGDLNLGYRSTNGTGTHGAKASLYKIAVTSGNTFVLSGGDNASTNILAINGTMKAYGNVTANNVKLSSGAVLTTGRDLSILDAEIDGSRAGVGTLNINQTLSTRGNIGKTFGLAAVNLKNGANMTLSHNMNATTITLGKESSSNYVNKLSTLTISRDNTYDAGGDGHDGNITIGGNIEGSGNTTVKGDLVISANVTTVGTIGATNSLNNITIRHTTGGNTGSNWWAVKGSVTAGSIRFQGSGSQNSTMGINGTATITGNIFGVGSHGNGTINVNSGTATFAGRIGQAADGNRTNRLSVRQGATMVISDNVSVQNNMTFYGVLDVNAATRLYAHGGSGNGTAAFIFGSTSRPELANTTILRTSNQILFSSNSSGHRSGGGGIEFHNATISLDGTHSSHISASTAYLDIGNLTSGGITQMANFTSVTVNLNPTTTTLTDGMVVHVIGRQANGNSNNGTLNVGSVTVTDNSQLLSFTTNNASIGTNDRSGTGLTVTVNYANSSTMGMTGNTKKVYDSAKTAIGSDSAIIQALAGMTTNAQIDSAVATLAPDASGGSAAGSAGAVSAQLDTVGARISLARAGGYETGVSTGDDSLDEGFWMQAFGTDLDQGARGGVSGFDADTFGIAVGLDHVVEESEGTSMLGVAASWANTDVTGKDSTTKTTNDIDTYQVSLYGTRDYGSHYIDGMMGYAANDNDATRKIVVGAVSRTAAGSYDSSLFAARIETGVPSKMSDTYQMTPTIGLDYSHLETDTYTETGAGNMNLTVNSKDVDRLEAKLGLKFSGESTTDGGSITRPEFRLGVAQELLDEKADSTSTFAGGGSAFTTDGLNQDDTFVDVGVGVSVTSPEGDSEIKFDLDGRFSDGRDEISGGVTARWNF